MKLNLISLLLAAVILLLAAMVVAQPLSTTSRWIVNDSTGERVKLACVNWVAHLEVAVAEGLSKQPVDVISRRVRQLGFNCVRLTWPTLLMTDDSFASTTVRQSFSSLGLAEPLAGIQRNNPSFADLTLIDAFKAVVASLGSNDVMVILDNHVSKPGWCCSGKDGNGFFGDQYFDPAVWINGLSNVAAMFNGVRNVIGMSLRNELRGPRQNIDDWYRYMERGAEAAHAANPGVLIILSGLSYDSELSFLQQRAVNLSFSKKLVFEVHWYGFPNSVEWRSGGPNEVCGRITGRVNRRAGFLLDQGYPLIVTEFGVDQRGSDAYENRFLNCFMCWAAEKDVDWALWTLVGSYYFRERVVGAPEYFGVYDSDWRNIRNPSLLQRISSLQTPFRGPKEALDRIMFHPATGLCVTRRLQLGPCSGVGRWSYSSDKVLTLNGANLCLQADSLGKPAKFGRICSDPASKWDPISRSQMQVASRLHNGTRVCLDVGSDKVLVTNTCTCLNNDVSCDPGRQWFKII